MNNDKIMVSVCMITYNHETYIAQAIEGVLMQKCDFLIELIIGEDCSTDKTRQICKEYALKYSEINLLPSETNIGLMPNFIRTLQACTGKYIALCEGDDYWTDPLKLQKQVDFLEGNPEFAGCAHQTLVVFEDNNKDPHIFQANVPKVIELKDILAGRKFHTASLVFRTFICNEHPFPPNITSGDRALFFLIIYYGKIYFFEDIMACYRKNSGGISSWVTVKHLEKDLEIVKWIVKINPSFPKYKYLSFIHSTIILYPKFVPLSKLVKHFFLYTFYSFSEFPSNIKSIVVIIRYDLPGIFKRSLKHT